MIYHKSLTLVRSIHCEPIFGHFHKFDMIFKPHFLTSKSQSTFFFLFNLFQLVPFVYPSFQSRILRYDLYIKGRDGWSAFNTMISEMDFYFHRFFIAIFLSTALSYIKRTTKSFKTHLNTFECILEIKSFVMVPIL